MKKIDSLLKQVEQFERLAVYGDRSTFLKSLAQDPFTKITVTNTQLLARVKAVASALMAAANNPEPGTSFDASYVKGWATDLMSYSEPPVNLYSLIGILQQIGNDANMGGEGSGMKIDAAKNAARQLAVYLRQVYSAPAKPQGQLTSDSKDTVQIAARLITELSNLADRDSKGMLFDQAKQDYLNRQSELTKTYAELKDKLALEQGVADGTNPYADDKDRVNSKYTIPIIQQQMKQLEALSQKMTNSRSSWAGMASPVKLPSV